MGYGVQDVTAFSTVSRATRRARWVASVAVVGLSACADAPPTPVSTMQPHAATWRIVVLGTGAKTEVQLRHAIGIELVRRAIATQVVDQAGAVDHVLEVEIQPRRLASLAKSGAGSRPRSARFFDAIETVRSGNDTSLAVQRIVHTGAPGADVPPDVATDPTRTLAFQIGAALN